MLIECGSCNSRYKVSEDSLNQLKAESDQKIFVRCTQCSDKIYFNPKIKPELVGVSCTNCGSEYGIERSKFKKTNLSVRCFVCKEVFEASIHGNLNGIKVKQAQNAIAAQNRESAEDKNWDAFMQQDARGYLEDNNLESNAHLDNSSLALNESPEISFISLTQADKDSRRLEENNGVWKNDLLSDFNLDSKDDKIDPENIWSTANTQPNQDDALNSTQNAQNIKKNSISIAGFDNAEHNNNSDNASNLDSKEDISLTDTRNFGLDIEHFDKANSDGTNLNKSSFEATDFKNSQSIADVEQDKSIAQNFNDALKPADIDNLFNAKNDLEGYEPGLTSSTDNIDLSENTEQKESDLRSNEFNDLYHQAIKINNLASSQTAGSIPDSQKYKIFKKPIQVSRKNNGSELSENSLDNVLNSNLFNSKDSNLQNDNPSKDEFQKSGSKLKSKSSSKFWAYFIIFTAISLFLSSILVIQFF